MIERTAGGSSGNVATLSWSCRARNVTSPASVTSCASMRMRPMWPPSRRCCSSAPSSSAAEMRPASTRSSPSLFLTDITPSFACPVGRGSALQVVAPDHTMCDEEVGDRTNCARLLADAGCKSCVAAGRDGGAAVMPAGRRGRPAVEALDGRAERPVPHQVGLDPAPEQPTHLVEHDDVERIAHRQLHRPPLGHPRERQHAVALAQRLLEPLLQRVGDGGDGVEVGAGHLQLPRQRHHQELLREKPHPHERLAELAARALLLREGRVQLRLRHDGRLEEHVSESHHSGLTSAWGGGSRWNASSGKGAPLNATSVAVKTSDSFGSRSTSVMVQAKGSTASPTERRSPYVTSRSGSPFFFQWRQRRIASSLARTVISAGASPRASSATSYVPAFSSTPMSFALRSASGFARNTS